MKFDNENSRCVSAGPEPDARVCVILRGEEVEIELKGRSMDLVKMASTALIYFACWGKCRLNSKRHRYQRCDRHRRQHSER